MRSSPLRRLTTGFSKSKNVMDVAHCASNSCDGRTATSASPSSFAASSMLCSVFLSVCRRGGWRTACVGDPGACDGGCGLAAIICSGSGSGTGTRRGACSPSVVTKESLQWRCSSEEPDDREEDPLGNLGTP